MKSSFHEDMYKEMFIKNGFLESNENKFTSLGQYFEIPKELGGGFYWVYTLDDQYSIKIHNFFFHEDILADFPGHEGLSVCYYKSVSGEELDPYRRLQAGHVRFLNYEDYHFRAMLHKNIPIQTVEIELYPAYYKKFISDKYGDNNFDFDRLYRSIDWCSDFKAMEKLLINIWNYKGEGLAAKLFYDSAVSSAMSLLIEYNSKRNEPHEHIYISPEDRIAIETVNKYINDHFSGDVSIEKLSRIACFGKTKFKILFKEVNKCTVTEYITNKRLSQAESLLTSTPLTIEQVADAVGYTNPSRFAALFKKSTGLFPSEYRRLGRKS